jgi:hypothetical protein
MLISLYSAPACWLLIPAHGAHPTDELSPCGALTFEGTVSSDLMAGDIWSRLLRECEQNTFARVSEALGLTLLEATFDRNGDVIAEDRPVA